jgi:hypothetical protein
MIPHCGPNHLFFFFSETDLTMYPKLPSNLPYSPGWPQTHGPQDARIGVYHYAWFKIFLNYVYNKVGL